MPIQFTGNYSEGINTGVTRYLDDREGRDFDVLDVETGESPPQCLEAPSFEECASKEQQVLLASVRQYTREAGQVVHGAFLKQLKDYRYGASKSREARPVGENIINHLEEKGLPSFAESHRALARG